MNPETLDRRASRFLLVMFLIATGLLVLVIAPFAGAFFFATVLSGALNPMKERLAGKLGGRPKLAAAILTVALVATVILPMTVVGVMVVEEGRRLTSWVMETARDEGIDGLIAPLPEPLHKPARHLAELITDQSLAATAESPDPSVEDESAAVRRPSIMSTPLIKQAAVAARQLLGGAVDIFVQLCILVIATFFLMSEGHRLVDYVVDLAPLSEERTRGMLERLRRVTAAVFSSTILTALLQTLVALVGYLIADIPAKTLVLFATLVFAFIPAIGAATITTGAGILLWMSGSVGMGIFLTAWGLVVVGLIDNVVKPLLAKNAIHLPGSLVFFAMICGLTVFGVMGIVAGPLIVAFFQVIAATLRDAQAVNPTNGVPTSS